MARKIAKAEGDFLSIGQAVERLKEIFPDLSISKVRYLEDEGLIAPKRTKGRYRLFSQEDISRLSEILRLQEEQFLPLTVIKDRLEDWEYKPSHGVAGKDSVLDEKTAASVSKIVLADLLRKTGLKADTIKVLKSFNLVSTSEDESELSPEEAEIITVFSKLNKFGIEAKHLRMYENLAQRETLLFQQILTPQIKRKSSKTKKKTTGELKEMVVLAERMRTVVLLHALKNADLI